VAQDKELSVDELKAKVAELEGQLDLKEENYQEALEVIGDLKDQLVAAKAGQRTNPTVTLGEDTYEVLEPNGFQFKGKLVTLVDLKASEDLVQALVDRKSGLLVKVEKPVKPAKTAKPAKKA
jgi:hypothetical protein